MERLRETLGNAIEGRPPYARSYLRAVSVGRTDLRRPRFTLDQLGLMAMFARGNDDKAVAQMTCRSLHTIRSQRRTIYHKCSVTCAAALACFAASYGILRYV
jgi:DNA-binding NarL/FixJ family response regulator